MDINSFVLKEISKFNKEEMERELKFKETYKLYSTSKKKKYCIDLIIIKFCF
ncbi:hypothetical protein [Bacillus sp. AFS041924]|jgi:hypothetical protein|uniref:hypothetical protein n=1 Tax=Bacillus sp. AFS041924 TaxID=2033503 RepID=UPI00159BD019|nr:hypothetical protein [Bacillus sp. AFS041924]